jgi:nitrilase
MSDTLRVAGAQLAPVWLHRDGTIARVVPSITEAAADGIARLAFPEAVVPGYPWWIEHTDGARFASHMQIVTGHRKLMPTYKVRLSRAR